ncbi:hypothetical protein [Mesorhizobium sp.]|uniref:hypothetical protein n=1 Tax=Mesorhizobium sp. TaxID=1871066 RepID=UPI001217DF4E|nr:hypothetical protein [Mesorhizobium sp.]TIV57493.1 MAG: hypothetical protein E5V80_22505 [Mesorhizobium sp.]
MNGNNGNRRAELANDIRRQAGSEATKRFLRTLPAFRLEKEVPRRLSGVDSRAPRLEQFREKCVAVFRPELRKKHVSRKWESVSGRRHA